MVDTPRMTDTPDEEDGLDLAEKEIEEEERGAEIRAMNDSLHAYSVGAFEEWPKQAQAQTPAPMEQRWYGKK